MTLHLLIKRGYVMSSSVLIDVPPPRIRGITVGAQLSSRPLWSVVVP
jgi:hypothetical protein